MYLPRHVDRYSTVPERMDVRKYIVTFRRHEVRSRYGTIITAYVYLSVGKQVSHWVR